MIFGSSHGLGLLDYTASAHGSSNGLPLLCFMANGFHYMAEALHSMAQAISTHPASWLKTCAPWSKQCLYRLHQFLPGPFDAPDLLDKAFKKR